MAAIDILPTTSDISFSVSAADKVAELIKEEDNFNLNLRVSITGGGCSGFQYGFSFDEQINEDDTVVEQHCSNNDSTVKLLIDSMSYQYLHDAELKPFDYTAFVKGLKSVLQDYPDATIAMPKIGAGLAGGDWSVISAIIEAISGDREIWVYEL